MVRPQVKTDRQLWEEMVHRNFMARRRRWFWNQEINWAESGEDSEYPPLLSGPIGLATGATTAALTVKTTEGNGTLYWYVSQSATPPSESDLQDGTGADAADSVSVTAPGQQEIVVTSLVAETEYYAHFLHIDNSNNASNIVSTAAFTTDAE